MFVVVRRAAVDVVARPAATVPLSVLDLEGRVVVGAAGEAGAVLVGAVVVGEGFVVRGLGEVVVTLVSVSVVTLVRVRVVMGAGGGAAVGGVPLSRLVVGTALADEPSSLSRTNTATATRSAVDASAGPKSHIHHFFCTMELLAQGVAAGNV